jgi:outer membrane protein
MKIINYLTNGVLFFIMLTLFSQCNSKPEVSSASSEPTSGSKNSDLRIAFIHVDSLLLNYNFSIDLNEQIVRKQENARANLTQKARAFQTEAEAFQYKLQNNAFATTQRAEQEQQRLQKKQQELAELEQKLMQELMEETDRMNRQLRDTIVSHLQEFKKERGYQIIFSNTEGSTIFLADEEFNITNEVIEYLNKRWSSSGNNN